VGRSGVITITRLSAGSPAKGSTFKQLKDRVYWGLGDQDRVLIAPVQIDGLVNDAYIDLCGRLRLNQAVVTDVTTEEGSITIPPDYVGLVELQIGNLPLKESTEEAFSSWQASGGRPGVVLFREVGSEIQTYPTDDTVNREYTLRYVQVPRKLADDNDLFVALPIEFEAKILAYVNAHIMWLAGNTSSGDRFMTSYMAGLPGDDVRKKWETAHPIKIV